jgi:hypothetical protein
MSHYLFLDFDGVLHPDELRFTSPFCFVDHFCAAVRGADPRGVLKIVISSSWRTTHSFDELILHFPMDVAIRMVGVTPQLPKAAGNRQREIEQWIQANAPGAHWLAVDDQPGLFDSDCQNLFAVPYTDNELQRDLRAMGHAATSAERNVLLERKRNNRSIGLSEPVAINLEECISRFMNYQ